MRRFRKNILSLFFLLTAVILSAGEEEDRLRNILRNIGGNQTICADFRQSNAMKGLKKPLELEGAFIWAKPGNFVWKITSPLQSQSILYRGVFTQWDEASGKTMRFDLKKYPATLTAMMTIQNLILDCENQEEYEAAFGTSEKELILKPKENGMIREIVLTLAKDSSHVKKLKVTGAKGDITELVFFNVKKNVKLSAGTWKIKQ